MKGTCSVADCERDVRARGLCANHYQEKRRNGEIEVSKKEKQPETCRVEGCTNKARAYQMCIKHFTRVRRHGDVEISKCVRYKGDCVVCGERKARTRQMCTRCYEKWMRDNVPEYRNKKVNKAHRRRARIEEREYENFTSTQILEKSNGLCGICGKPIDPKARKPDFNCLSLDHIIPISKGGTHTLANVQAAHLICNIAKGNKLV
jgi:5-methylcytosine-specific restriction endonuclease McrA